MRAFFIIIRASAKRHVTLWALAAVLIALVAICFNSFFYLPQTVYSSILSKTEELYGAQSAIVLRAQRIDSPDNGYFTSFGYVECDDKNSPLVFGTADEDAVRISRIKVIDGRYPQTDGEIAVERDVLRKLDIGFVQGKTLRFEINVFNDTGDYDCVARTYTLVGVIENYANAQTTWVSPRERDPIADRLPTVICFSAGGNIQVTHASVGANWLLNDTAIYNYAAVELGVDDVIASVSINRNVIDFRNGSSDERLVVSALESLRILFGICGVIICGLSLYLFAARDKKRLLWLSNLGMTHSRVLMLVFAQQMLVISVGCIAALLLSNVFAPVISALLTKIFGITIVEGIRQNFLLPAGVFVLLISLTALIITPLCMKREKSIVADKGRNMRIPRNAYTLMLTKNMLKRPGRFICVAIAICACLMMISEAVAYWQTGQAKKLSCDIKIDVDSYTFATSLRIPVDTYIGATQTQVDELVVHYGNVREALAVRKQSVNFTLPQESYLTKYFETALLRPIMSGADGQNEYSATLQRFGYDINMPIYSHTAYELDISDITNVKKVYGSIADAKLHNGQSVAIFTSERTFSDKMLTALDKQICFTRINWLGETGETSKRVDFTASVCAIVVFDDSNGLMCEAFAPGVNFVFAHGALGQVGVAGADLYTGIYLNLKDVDNEEEICQAVDRVIANTHGLKQTSNVLRSRKEMAQRAYIASLTLAVVVPLMLLAFLTIIFSHINEMNVNKALYRRLNVIGMIRGRINLLLLLSYWQCLFAAYLLFIMLIILRIITEGEAYYATLNGAFFAQSAAIAFVLYILFGGTLYVYQNAWLKRVIKS